MSGRDERALIVAPLGRDAAVTSQLLTEHGLSAEPCSSIDALIEAFAEGVGLAIVTEEVLTDAAVQALLAAVAAQPSWSELPIITLLAARERRPADGLRLLMRRGRTTLLRRPVPSITLVSAAQTALDARRRQYQVRDLLQAEREAREQAEEATRLKDQFLASVSHELRTPLSAILLWSALLERGDLGAERTDKAIQAIQHSAHAQTRLIEDLLDLARIVSGKLRLEPEWQDVGAIARAAFETVSPVAERKGVRIACARIDRAELCVDAERLQQVVWNLLNNAVKFTPAGREVRLSVERGDDGVRIVVHDTGMGIGPELLPYVFERFRQGDGSTRRKHAGLGIGLPIAKELVELHGGTLEVASAGLDQGATFTVHLPASLAAPR